MTSDYLIQTAADLGASDVHIVYGVPPKLRLSGELEDMPGEAPLDDAACEDLAAQLLGDAMPESGEADLSGEYGGHRIRANIFRQSGHVSCALRILADDIPDLKTLGLPPAVEDLPALQRGIVLVTGETGSGKSTTLASLLNRINNTRRDHIITLEDPIEYIHKPNLSLINQREIGRDTVSYAEGLRAILREDPDVILIGEMRDLITIETALTAAETGHLVFATLHTNSAADSVDRMVDVFPAERQHQIRMQLSMTLQAVLSQQLLKKKGGGRVAACELMMVTPAIRNLIREGKTPQIANALATSADVGSVTMDNAIVKLYKDKLITADVARAAAHDADFVKKNTMY